MNKMSHTSCLLSVYVTFKITDQWGLYHPSTFNLEDIMGVYTHTHTHLNTYTVSLPYVQFVTWRIHPWTFCKLTWQIWIFNERKSSTVACPVTLPNGKDTSPTSHKKQRKHHDFDFPFLHRKHWKKFYWMCDFKKEL